MEVPNLNDVLNQAIQKAKPNLSKGKLADYIPELTKSNPENIGICMVDLEKNIYEAGDSNVKFTIQSVSKPIMLALALLEHDEEKIFSKVGKEPSGDPFNSYMKLEIVKPSKPYNPFINAGAIAIASIIKGENLQQKEDKILEFFRKMACNPDISINDSVFKSEKETGHRNRAIGHILKNEGIIEGDVEETLDLYFKQCSIEVTVKDLALMGLCLAQNGINYNGERIIDEKTSKIVKAFMFTCGMYDESGEYAINVGIPSKSGVGGGIMASVPFKYGIGTYSPSLDCKGNSIGGLDMLKFISEELNLSIL